jgi:hypothetical protein
MSSLSAESVAQLTKQVGESPARIAQLMHQVSSLQQSTLLLRMVQCVHCLTLSMRAELLEYQERYDELRCLCLLMTPSGAWCSLHGLLSRCRKRKISSDDGGHIKLVCRAVVRSPVGPAASCLHLLRLP